MNTEKKVCHVTSVHSRYDIRIFKKQCISLAKNGYDVTLLVNDTLPNEEIDKVKIISTGFVAKSRLDRFLNSKKHIKKALKNIEADIYQLHDPELLSLGKYIKKQLNAKTIFDFHELVKEQIMYKSWIPNVFKKLISKLYSKYESTLAKNYDALISVSPQIVEYYKKMNDNTIMVTNYPNLLAVDATKGTKKQRTLFFAGGISSQWSIHKAIEAIEDIDGVELVLAGRISDSYLNKLKELKGFEKTNYLGMIDHSKVLEIYNNCMAGLSLLSYDTQVGKQGTLGNTKIYEIMQCQIPVICSDTNIWHSLISEYECGIAVNPNSSKEIASAIKYLLENQEEAKQMGENGRKAVTERYNWQIEEQKLLNMYSTLITTKDR